MRSGRDWLVPPEVPVVLAGLGGAAVSVPKKSSPKSEAFELVALGGAGSAFGGTFDAVGPVVLALTGIGSAPIRSGTGAGAGIGAGTDREAAVGVLDWLRRDPFLSRVCFSFTTLSGTSSSPSASSVEGSGIGPSITHLLSSYLVRIKFSIFDSEGTWP